MGQARDLRELPSLRPEAAPFCLRSHPLFGQMGLPCAPVAPVAISERVYSISLTGLPPGGSRRSEV